MGWWEVSADTLAGSRFVVSPLAETTACLISLAAESAAHPAERAWLHTHLPAYRARLAADPITALLVRAALGPRWIADYLIPAPGDDDTGADRDGGGAAGDALFRRELAQVREVPATRVRTDLAVTLDGPLPGALADRTDLAGRSADLLDWLWQEAVRPDWPRRRRVIEADMVARTGQLGRGGWAAAVADMRPGMRWLGGNRLQINAYDRPPRELSGARMVFVPVTQARGWVSWNLAGGHVPGPEANEGPDRGDQAEQPTQAAGGEQRDHPAPGGRPCYAVVYPCSGALLDAGVRPAPEALGALLGPVRAAVLTLLDSPKSTTQLVALTGQGLGSVGRHLKILLAARLVERRRAGRSVLYYRTAAGETLIRAQRR